MKRIGWSKKMLIMEISGEVRQLETVQHGLSAVMRVWSFTDCVLVTLSVISSSSSIIFKPCSDYLMTFNF